MNIEIKKKILNIKRSEAGIEEQELAIMEFEDNIIKKQLVLISELQKKLREARKYKSDSWNDIKRIEGLIIIKTQDIENYKKTIELDKEEIKRIENLSNIKSV